HCGPQRAHSPAEAFAPPPLISDAPQQSSNTHENPHLPSSHMSLSVKILIFFLLLLHLGGAAWIISVIMRTVSPPVPPLPVRR
ncbi:MAG: hypothetical protein Q8P67_26425, partial [archaeon]|nr:hypothetical protein [archaeon]